MSTFPSNCEPQSDFLYFVSSTLHTCIPTTLSLISTLLGICSILSWLFSQLPQIIKNFNHRSTSGLSIYFLGEWFLGDVSNLLGSFLTQQASWQVILASYYCLVDCMLLGQWIYFEYLRHGRVVHKLRWQKDGPAPPPPPSSPHRHHRRSRRRKNKKKPPIPFLRVGNASFVHSNPINASPKPQIKKSLLDEMIPPGGNSPRPSSSLLMPSSFHSFSFPKPSAINSDAKSPTTSTLPTTKTSTLLLPRLPSPAPSPRTLLFISLLFALLSSVPAHGSPLSSATTSAPSLPFFTNAGTIFAWLSTFLYFGSRLPQLLYNFTRRSTAGLSPALFIAAFAGNFFYSLSLLANPCLWYAMPAHGGGYGWNQGSTPTSPAEWAVRALPFFLGAALVLVMDGAMGVQFILWGGDEHGFTDYEGQEDGHGHVGPVVLVVVDEDEGRISAGADRWKRVQGWMRGWTPQAKQGSKVKRVVESGELETDIEYDIEYDTDTDTDTDTDSLLGNSDGIRRYGGV